MKGVKKISMLVTGIVLAILIIMTGSIAHALTAGETYTITVDKIFGDGTVYPLSLSTTAVADSDGKISFSLSGIPDNSTCNFLVTTIKDSGDTTVRRALSPCPNAGEALPLGVSGLTNSQTDALIAALAAAGTDDPIVAVFGYAIVRSSAITASELVFMADLCNQGINNTGGFVDYLTSNGVSSTQIALYRTSIIQRLANTASGYSKLVKDSVDATSDAEKFNARGEAASQLLLVLVQAATDALFAQDRVLEAFNAMGSVVVPLMATGQTNGDITAATKQMIDSSIGGGIQKLKADKDIEKYSKALVALGASGADVTAYQTAASALMDAMEAAFKTFEQVFDGSETDTGIQTAQTAMDTAMQAAFDQFMSDSDTVIGLEINGEVKAYPIFILVWHEIVNDSVGGTPVSVTYCPLCYTNQVFERIIDGQEVEFGTSGKLYNSNLLMYDRLTESYWSQALGMAVKGELTGYQLNLVPFDVITWGDWKKLHPDTLVLTTDTGYIRSYATDPYGNYYI